MGATSATARTAIITGGASGIGAALARALGESGANVVIADRRLDPAEKLAAELPNASAVELDVRDLDAMKRMVDATVARTGRVDMFFNNAGIAVFGEMDRFTPQDWTDAIDVNLRGVVNGVQAVYPQMIRQRSGHIINTASMAGLIASAAQGPYTTTKHAVVGLSKALRAEGRQHGVRVSVLCPGVIRTQILDEGHFGRMAFESAAKDHMIAMLERSWPMDPDVFARRALRAIARDKAIIVFPRWWKIAWYLERVSPWLLLKLAEIGMRKLRRDLTAMGAR